MASRVLITGAAGFIGGALWRHLAGEGYHVLAQTATPPAGRIPAGDVRVFRLPTDAFRRLVEEERPDWLVHCAGTSSITDSFKRPTRDFVDNVESARCVLEALRLGSPSTRFLFLSSAAVYGEAPTLPLHEQSPTAPISPYGFHKLIAETLCRQYTTCHEVPTLILRVFSAYGPGLRRQVLWDIFQQSQGTRPLVLFGTGLETRDFIYIDDLARAIHLAMLKASFDARVLNVASGTATSIERVARLTLAALGVEKATSFSREARPGDPSHWQADLRLLEGLGMGTFVPIDDGIRRYVNWLRAESHRAPKPTRRL